MFRFVRLRPFRHVIGGVSAAVLLALLVGCGSAPSEPAPAPSDQQPAGNATGPIPTLSGRVAPGPPGVATVVVLEPTSPLDVPPPTEPAFMDQISMAFVPDLLTARVGQPVRFANSDQELHNVRVVHNVTRETVFNVGTPAGGYYEHTFEAPGVYAVMCDVHTAMGATIYATTTPYVAVADREGEFVFRDVVPGAYRLTIDTGGDTSEHFVDVLAGQHRLPDLPR